MCVWGSGGVLGRYKFSALHGALNVKLRLLVFYTTYTIYVVSCLISETVRSIVVTIQSQGYIILGMYRPWDSLLEGRNGQELIVLGRLTAAAICLCDVTKIPIL